MFWWWLISSNKPLKRESGANPEQSRCCNSYEKLIHNPCHWMYREGRISWEESENLPKSLSKAFESKVIYCLQWILNANYFYLTAAYKGYLLARNIPAKFPLCISRKEYGKFLNLLGQSN